MVLSSYATAWGLIRSRGFRPVLVLGVALNLALLAAVFALLLALILPQGAAGLPPAAAVRGLADLATPGVIALLVVLSPLLMVPVASAFTGLFLHDVAGRAEAAAGLPGGRPIPPWEGFVANVNFFGVLVAVNLTLLILAPVLGLVGLALFLVLNAVLLGYEFLVLAAQRHMPARAARRLWRAEARRASGAGLVLMGLLMVPGLNLVAPVWAAAAFALIAGRVSRPPAG